MIYVIVAVGGGIVPEGRLLGPTGRSAPQSGLTRVGWHPRMAAWVGRHPRMVVPGRSGTPELPDSMYAM